MRERRKKKRRSSWVFPGLLTGKLFDALAKEFQSKTGWCLSAINTDGVILRTGMGSSETPSSKACAQVLQEALRWGEPNISLGEDDLLQWAIPVMQNQVLLGGLIVCGVPLERPGPAGSLDLQVKGACNLLWEMAARENLTNTALLEEKKRKVGRENERALALHALKERIHDDIRVVYLKEEPGLLSAIRRGDRREARKIIDRVLTAIYMLGQKRLELLKSLCLELVVMMTRAAVQAGGEPAKILGLNFQSLSTVARLSDPEQVSAWLCEMLERLIDALQENTRLPNSEQLARALRYMERNIGSEITRAEVAHESALSLSHFSRMIRAKTGFTFVQLLNRMRVAKAEALLSGGESITVVALECGYSDQSYFTRIFRKETGLTPGEFRRRHIRDHGGAQKYQK